MVTYCHSLSLVVLLVVTRCHLLYHSLSFVVSRCQSLSLVVPLVCLFINDLSIIFYAFSYVANFILHGICIDFGNQKIYYLINLYFFVAYMGQPKSVLTRCLGTFLGFQNYELLDLFSSIVQLEVKHSYYIVTASQNQTQ